MSQHDEVPSDPADGERFTCSHCGVTSEFVVLDDGLPGEWVDTTPLDVSNPTPAPLTTNETREDT